MPTKGKVRLKFRFLLLFCKKLQDQSFFDYFLLLPTVLKINAKKGKVPKVLLGIPNILLSEILVTFIHFLFQ